VTSPRIVQLGSGSPRPLLLVYHLNARNDAALRRAMGPAALIVNDTTEGSSYGDTPSLAATVAALRGQIGGAALSPVIVAGFSAGGFATARILAQGGDPDALVVADGTYATTPAGYADWASYADRAKRRERVMVASHTSLIVPSSTWHVLSAISGVLLPLGAAVANRPAGVPAIPASGSSLYRSGNLFIYSYPTDDKVGHEQQGDLVLPMMLQRALAMIKPAAVGPIASSRIGKVATVGIVATLVAVALAGRR
jgi:pimeloyl-ACP methyl ester carboxylesterase